MTKPRRPRIVALPIDDVAWAILTDGPLPPRTEANAWDLFVHTFHRSTGERRGYEGVTVQDLWSEYGAGVVEDWIEERPGSRPPCWWEFDAPEPLLEGEAQAAYLARHGLFLPGERQKLAEKR